MRGLDDAVLGGCGLHGRLCVTGLEIGYWVHIDHIGRGLATDASAAWVSTASSISAMIL